MKVTSSYRLVTAIRPGYAERLDAICAKFKSFRAELAIDWRARVEAWLRNFSGFVDQETALGLLERVRVISRADEIEGCTALLAQLGEAADPATLRHFAHETSGTILIRVLEKELGVESGAILRHSSFEDANLEAVLREGAAVVIWDRFNGTGTQLRDQAGIYRPILDRHSDGQSALRFAYLAGHALAEPLPQGVHLHRWIEAIPTVTDRERELCSKYAAAAGAGRTAGRFDTGALMTFWDNLPNNVPHVLCAKGTSTWSPLFDRKGTQTARRRNARKR